MMELVVQLVLGIGSIVSTICGTVILLARMKRYVTVDEYRVKTSGLHAEINDLRTRVAVLEDRAKR